MASVYANQLQLHDDDRSDLFRVRHNWSYQRRGQGSGARDRENFFSGWGRSRGVSSDAGTWGIFGQDNTDGGLYEPIQVVDGGIWRPWFVKGLCTDGAGNPLAAVQVELFTAGTLGVVAETYVGDGITDQNGYYSIPTSRSPGQNFIVYANYASGTYVGASVATVQSAL